jgi:hypothetical protein
MLSRVVLTGTGQDERVVGERSSTSDDARSSTLETLGRESAIVI